MAKREEETSRAPCVCVCLWKFIGASVFWAESGGPHGCQNVVPNANDVVDSHLTRDYPLNGGLRPVANLVRLVHGNPVITTTRIHF